LHNLAFQTSSIEDFSDKLIAVLQEIEKEFHGGRTLRQKRGSSKPERERQPKSPLRSSSMCSFDNEGPGLEIDNVTVLADV